MEDVLIRIFKSGLILLALALLTACSPAVEEASVQSQSAAQQQAADGVSRIDGHPSLNGVWQAMNTAWWNLEAHSAQALEDFWQMGAIAAIPAGTSVIRGGGPIPYLPEALQKRNDNRANWPQADPEASCYMLGVPRSVYHHIPFQIVQGTGDILFSSPFAASTRVIYMNDQSEPPIDSWMGKSRGEWEGDTLVVTTSGLLENTWLDRAGNHHSNQLRVTERFTLQDSGDHIWYEATLDDPQTWSEPWTIEMMLYRHVEENAQILEHKCVEFADKLLYSDLLGLDEQD